MHSERRQSERNLFGAPFQFRKETKGVARSSSMRVPPDKHTDRARAAVSK